MHKNAHVCRRLRANLQVYKKSIELKDFFPLKKKIKIIWRKMLKLSLAIVSLAIVAHVFSAELSIMQQWQAFKTAHGKQYSSHQEELLRLNIWNANLEYVQQHNADADAGKHTFWLKMNAFGDMVC
jgi:hypothetical protein